MVRKVAGTYFLFSDEKDGDMEHPLVLNETGFEIYKSVMAGETKEAIAQRLSKTYDIPYEDAFSDVVLCISELETHLLNRDV